MGLVRLVVVGIVVLLGIDPVLASASALTLALLMVAAQIVYGLLVGLFMLEAALPKRTILYKTKTVLTAVCICNESPGLAYRPGGVGPEGISSGCWGA